LLPILIDHLFSLLLFLYDVGCKLMLTRIGQETNWLLKIGLNIFGSVRFWTKINNQTNFFFNFLNRTEPKTGSNQLISVRYGFFPFQTGSNRNYSNLFTSQKNPYIEEGNEKSFLFGHFDALCPNRPRLK